MEHMLRVLALAASVLLAPGALSNQSESDAAADAYKNGRYLEAYYVWKALAADGDPTAAHNLAVLHTTGQGVTRDLEKAAELYRESANAGYAPAQFNLGMAYLAGAGVDQDNKKAARWWLQAAEQDNVQAIFNLAMLFDKGLGLKKNPELARRLYGRAAELGDARAEQTLSSMDAAAGVISEDKTPTHAESVRREDWIKRQADDNYTIQVLASVDNSKVVDFIEAYPVEGGYAVFEAQVDGQTWYKVLYGSFRTVVEAGNAVDRMRVLLDGETSWLRRFASVKREMAGEGYTSVAEPSANRNAEREMGVDLQKGQAAFNRQRYDEALELWLPLARRDEVEAQYGIGFMYESGWGVAKDPALAAQWYERAAELGHAKSQFNLGMLYLGGRGVDKDDETGRMWIKKAAEQGDSRAVEYLASAAF